MNSKSVPPNYALVELYSDGFVRVYGDKSLRCQIFNRPHCNSVELAKRAEELVENALPLPYREIYFPGMVRSTAIHRKIKPVDIRTTIGNIALLNPSVATSDTENQPMPYVIF